MSGGFLLRVLPFDVPGFRRDAMTFNAARIILRHAGIELVLK